MPGRGRHYSWSDHSKGRGAGSRSAGNPWAFLTRTSDASFSTARVRAEGPGAAMALLPQALASGDVTVVVLARWLPADPAAVSALSRSAAVCTPRP